MTVLVLFDNYGFKFKVAICGSDINLYKWNETAKQIAALPFTPGIFTSRFYYYYGGAETNFDNTRTRTST